LIQRQALYSDVQNTVTLNQTSKETAATTLAPIQEQVSPENIDQQWYNNQILDNLVVQLSNTTLVDTVAGGRIPLKEALIPSYKNRSKVQHFAQLASEFYPEYLPQANHILDWHDILKSVLGQYRYF